MKPRSQPPLTLGAWLRHDEIARVVGEAQPQTVLEFGVGQGAMGARLADGRAYVGVEPDDQSRAAARVNLPETARLLSDIDELDEQAFDLICAFEVLEHIEDDRAALVSWLTRLRPGGTLLISVPGFESRFGPSDENVGHLRRYDPETLEALLCSTGLIQPRLTITGYPLGFMLEAIRNQMARRQFGSAVAVEPASQVSSHIAAPSDAATRSAASGRYFQPAAILGPLTRGGSAPFRWIQTRRPGIGTGIVASAIKPL